MFLNSVIVKTKGGNRKLMLLFVIGVYGECNLKKSMENMTRSHVCHSSIYNLVVTSISKFKSKNENF